MNIFTLTGTILVDSSKAQNSISKTSEEAEGLGSKLASGVATATKWGTAVVAAASAVGGAMVAMAKDTASQLDVVDKASIRMGIAAESYQELAYAAGLSGVSMTTMERAAKKLVGTDMDFDDALQQVMAIGDESKRTTKAIELFGEKAAYEMQPLLKEGTKGLAAMRQEANDLGLVLSQDTVSSAAALNDMFDKVSQSITGVKNSIVADLMPYISEILQWIIDNVPLIKGTITSLVDTLMPIVQLALETIMSLLPPILDVIKTVLDGIMPIVTPIVKAITYYLQALFDLLDGNVDGFYKKMTDFITTLTNLFKTIGKTIVNALLEGLKAVWQSVEEWVKEKVDWLAQQLDWGEYALDWNTVASKRGSHASGLNYVPFDGYQATLHKGEAVLSSSNTNSMVQDIINGINSAGRTSNQPIELTLNIDGKAFAKAVYNDLNNESKRHGVSFVGA